MKTIDKYDTDIQRCPRGNACIRQCAKGILCEEVSCKPLTCPGKISLPWQPEAQRGPGPQTKV